MPVFARMFELDFMKETVLCDHEIMCDLRPDVAEGNALTEMIRMAISDQFLKLPAIPRKVAAGERLVTPLLNSPDSKPGLASSSVLYFLDVYLNRWHFMLSSIDFSLNFKDLQETVDARNHQYQKINPWYSNLIQ